MTASGGVAIICVLTNLLGNSDPFSRLLWVRATQPDAANELQMCPRYWSTGWLLVESQRITVWGSTKFELYFKSSFWQFNDDFHAKWISCQFQRPFSKNKKEYFIVHKVVQVVSKAFPLEMLLYEAQFLWIEGMCLCVCAYVYLIPFSLKKINIFQVNSAEGYINLFLKYPYTTLLYHALNKHIWKARLDKLA